MNKNFWDEYDYVTDDDRVEVLENELDEVNSEIEYYNRVIMTDQSVSKKDQLYYVMLEEFKNELEIELNRI
jgi:hypothetical protein